MLLPWCRGSARYVAPHGLNERTAQNRTCAEYSGCRGKGCGLCACGEEGAPFGFFPYGFGWQLVGNTIALAGSGALISYHYCVSGDRLTLTQPDSQVLYQLERVELAGSPLACAQRSPEACVVPVNPMNPARHAESEDDACHFACTGGPNCAAATYDTQCQDAGCTWDVTQCAGEPARECYSATTTSCQAARPRPLRRPEARARHASLPAPRGKAQRH